MHSGLFRCLLYLIIKYFVAMSVSWEFMVLDGLKKGPRNKISQSVTPSSLYLLFFLASVGIQLRKGTVDTFLNYLRHSAISPTYPQSGKISFHFSYFLQSLCCQTNVKMVQVVENCDNFSNIYFGKEDTFQTCMCIVVEIKYHRIVPIILP